MGAALEGHYVLSGVFLDRSRERSWEKSQERSILMDDFRRSFSGTILKEHSQERYQNSVLRNVLSNTGQGMTQEGGTKGKGEHKRVFVAKDRWAHSALLLSGFPRGGGVFWVYSVCFYRERGGWMG